VTEVQHRRNSFDILRFIAASLVVYSHSFALTGLPEPHVGSTTFGGVGVWGFFAMSGYLIAGSWEQYPRFPVFIGKRALRIFPGLFVAISVSILALGFYSSLSYSDYLSHQQTVSYLNNILLINTHYSLPGVFSDNVYPNAVNGSLWTLAFEFFMYLLVALCGIIGALKVRWVWPLWSLLVALNIVAQVRPRYLTFSVLYLDMRLVAQLGLLYFSGVLLYLHRARVKYPVWAWGPALVFYVLASNQWPAYSWLFGSTLFSYGILGASRLTIFSSFGKFGDFSYGIYVYSFPVQQSIWHHTQTKSPIRMFALAMAISLALAVISWFVVEKPCVQLKQRLRPELFPLRSERGRNVPQAM
jgi:peptidoglycan/LPS O-acetylase OafA/YrhL